MTIYRGARSKEVRGKSRLCDSRPVERENARRTFIYEAKGTVMAHTPSLCGHTRAITIRDETVSMLTVTTRTRVSLCRYAGSTELNMRHARNGLDMRPPIVLEETLRKAGEGNDRALANPYDRTRLWKLYFIYLRSHKRNI